MKGEVYKVVSKITEEFVAAGTVSVNETTGIISVEVSDSDSQDYPKTYYFHPAAGPYVVKEVPQK